MIGFPLKVAIFTRGVVRRRMPFPWQFEAELSNRCNLECRMCLRIPMGVPQEDMSQKVFDALVNNLTGVQDLILRGWGEPLMHENFPAMVEQIRTNHPKVPLRITTNGHLLGVGRVNQVIRECVDRVMVSIDRTDGIDRGGHSEPEKVMANVKDFIEERGSSHSPRIILQPAMHRGGLNDILDVVRFAIDVGADMVNLLRMNVQLVNGVLRPTPVEEKHIVNQARKAANGTPVKIFFLNQKALPVKLASHNDRLCLRTLFQAYIDVRGNVAPCCVLRDLVMGNILDQSIDEIWRSERFKRFFDEQEKYCHGCDAFFSIYHG